MDPQFEKLVEAAASLPSRRAVLRGLAGVVGAAGLGLTFAGESEANSRRRRRRQRQRRRERRNRQCSNKKPCEASLNPCQTTSCRKHKCQTANVADGTVCGDGLVCQAGACLCPNGVCTVYVTPANLGPWVALVDPVTVDTSVLNFQSGPGSPPFGSGSVSMSVTDEAYVLANFQYSGVALADITSLTYSTYQPAGSDDPSNAGQMVMSVDFFGQNLPYEGIIFTPSGNSTPVQQDAWQTWDAIAGGTALWTYAQGCGCTWPNSAMSGDTPRTWADITSSYKLARITTADPTFGILVENVIGGETFTENINAVTFGTSSGTTRFVFGPTGA